MFPWLDLIIAAVVVISVIKGYKDGFTKSFLTLVQFAASIVLSYIFYPKLASHLLANAEWTKSLEQTIIKIMGLSQTYNAAAKSVTAVIVSIICFAAIYLACWIVFKVLILIAGKIAEIPVLKQVNKLGGIAVGAFKGLLLSAAFSTVMWLLSQMGIAFAAALCESSYLVKFLYLGSILERF